MASKTTVKTEIVEPDNSPNVISYRVAQLEKTVVLGFKEHNDKLDALVNNFASRAEVQEIKVIVAEQSAQLKVLAATDNRQQGSLDAQKRYLSLALVLLGLVEAGIAIFFGVHK